MWENMLTPPWLFSHTMWGPGHLEKGEHKANALSGPETLTDKHGVPEGREETFSPKLPMMQTTDICLS